MAYVYPCLHFMALSKYFVGTGIDALDLGEKAVGPPPPSLYRTVSVELVFSFSRALCCRSHLKTILVPILSGARLDDPKNARVHGEDGGGRLGVGS
jgi:hypothetical protein